MAKKMHIKKQGATNNPVDENERADERVVDESSPMSFSLQSSHASIAEAKKRQQDFFKYLKKRQIVKSIELKQLTTEAKEKEFYEEEAVDRMNKHVFDVDFDMDSFDERETDYYEETYYSNNDEGRL
jgi:hypothetical protein